MFPVVVNLLIIYQWIDESPAKRLNTITLQLQLRPGIFIVRLLTQCVSHGFDSSGRLS